MLIDTHTHFDFPIFDDTRYDDWQKAQSLGVSAQFMMSVSPSNFAKVEQIANDFNGTFFALGIHPMFIDDLDLNVAMALLKQTIEENINNPKFIGIGEIGLDWAIGVEQGRQIAFFTAQLKLAKDYDLPVFLHIRKAQDQIVKYCKQFQIQRGIAHAFNGSEQQAKRYIEQGLKLGFGGAFTFDRAKNLQRLIKTLPIDAFVLETDSPDMSPAWNYGKINYSYHLPCIAEQFANIRGIDTDRLSKQLNENICEITPTIIF